jgi:hypothetical protein
MGHRAHGQRTRNDQRKRPARLKLDNRQQPASEQFHCGHDCFSARGSGNRPSRRYARAHLHHVSYRKSNNHAHRGRNRIRRDLYSDILRTRQFALVDGNPELHQCIHIRIYFNVNEWLASTGYQFVSVGTPAAQQFNLQVDTSGQENYGSMGIVSNSGKGVSMQSDDVDSFNGQTGFGSIVSKYPVLELGYNGQTGLFGIYDDNTLDTLIDCYPPAGGDECTITTSLPQENGTDFLDHGIMNYGANTGLQTYDYISKTTAAANFPSYILGWWDAGIGSNAAVAYPWLAATTSEGGIYGTTTAIAIGDIATSSYSSANGVNLSGATIQIISSSSRPTLLSVSEHTAKVLLQIFSVNQGGASTTNKTDAGYLNVTGAATVNGTLTGNGLVEAGTAYQLNNHTLLALSGNNIQFNNSNGNTNSGIQFYTNNGASAAEAGLFTQAGLFNAADSSPKCNKVA